MKRWLRQRDTFSCGPIALINLDKWRGKSVTNQDLPRYRRQCHCHRPRGNSIADFSRVAGRSHYRLDYHRFKRHLLSGGTAIINIRWPSGGGHYFFVRGIADYNGCQGFLAVNFHADETLTLLSWQHIFALLQRGRTWIFRP